jgi:hypothetical protein
MLLIKRTLWGSSSKRKLLLSFGCVRAKYLQQRGNTGGNSGGMTVRVGQVVGCTAQQLEGCGEAGTWLGGDDARGERVYLRVRVRTSVACGWMGGWGGGGGGSSPST